MNATLLRKELTCLRPCMLLGGILVAVGWAYALMEFPDRPSLTEADATSGLIFSAVLMGLLTGLLAMNQEREQNTQGFLDGLPVARLSILFHKFLAACFVMAVYFLAELATHLLKQWLEQTSISEPLPWQAAAAMGVLGAYLGVIVVAWAMALSFSRKWFPLMAGLMIVGLVMLQTQGLTWTLSLDATTLLSPTYSKTEGLWIPWRQVIGLGTLGVVGLLTATLLYTSRDGALNRWAERNGSGFARACAVILAVAVWLVAFGFMFKNEDSRDFTHQARTSAAAGTSTGDALVEGFGGFETKYYEVIYKGSHYNEVAPLHARMDEVYESVASFFHSPDLPKGRIVLDVASAVQSHAAGVTTWTKIRVPFAKAGTPDYFLRVLRHETAHVFIEQLSQGAASDHFNAMRAFHEGVATAAEVATQPAQAESTQRWAALASTRSAVPLDMLLDDAQLASAHDPTLVYPLGYVLARSLEKVGGPTLVPRILASFENSPPPLKPSSTQLWSHVLQQCGVSYEQVLAAYAAEINRLQNAHAEFTAQFPRLSAKVTVEKGTIIIRPDPQKKPPPLTHLHCEIERDHSLLAQNEILEISADGTYQIPRKSIPGNKIRYLLGWINEDIGQAVNEPWAEAVLADP